MFRHVDLRETQTFNADTRTKHHLNMGSFECCELPFVVTFLTSIICERLMLRYLNFSFVSYVV